jgi:hypothetical protein
MSGRKWNLDKALERIVERISLAPIGERPELLGLVTMRLVSRLRAVAEKELNGTDV